MQELNAQMQAQFGPGDYRPSIPLAFWSFRWMIGLGMLSVLGGLAVWWLTRKGRVPRSRWVLLGAALLPFGPLLGAALGWIFTETARQPWVVFGLMQTSAGVSPTLTTAQIWTSLITFTLLYGALAVIEVGLLIRAIKIGSPESVELLDAGENADDGRELTFSY